MPEKPTRRRFLGSAAAASVPFCLSAMVAADLDAVAEASRLGFEGGLGEGGEAGGGGGKEMGELLRRAGERGGSPV
jgi:hypothetical protein